MVASLNLEVAPAVRHSPRSGRAADSAAALCMAASLNALNHRFENATRRGQVEPRIAGGAAI